MIKIQSAAISDIELIVQLSEKSPDSSLSQSQIYKMNEQNNLFAIQADDVVVGFIAQCIILDEAELIQLLVHPEYRGTGFAYDAVSLWHRQLKELKVANVYLEVRETNESAFFLYQKLGYEITGRRKLYYNYQGQLADALVMSISL